MSLHRTDYFEYEYQAAKTVLGACLKSLKPFRSALDLGCGYGGCLKYLIDEKITQEAVGVDYDPEMIQSGRSKLKASDRVSLHCEDLLRYSSDQKHELILLRDVVEHIPDLDSVIRKVSALLAANGLCFISFSPFFSPFGGHQHCLDGWMSRVPYSHLFTLGTIFRYSRASHECYKSAPQLQDDLKQVLSARLTIRSFERALRQSPLRVAQKRTYLVRPEFRLKYDLPSIKNVSIPFCPYWEEATSTGVTYLLQRP